MRALWVFGAICLILIFLLDFRGIQSLILFLFSAAIIFLGQKIFTGDTSENWLNFSYAEIAKNTLGGALILIGWIIFMRGVFAVAISALILKAD